MRELTYLDFAATTPLLPAVRHAMREAEDNFFANASALHTPGHVALSQIEETRELLAEILNCKPDELIFTASASEANNTVIQTFKNHEIITSPLEHHSIIVPAEIYASKHSSCDISSLKESSNSGSLKQTSTSQIAEGNRSASDAIGELAPQVANQNLNQEIDRNWQKFIEENPYTEVQIPPENAKLYSFMLANNEIGEILDLETVVKTAHQHHNFVHSDLTQCLGKIPLDLSKLNLDYATVSAHKIGGPVGVAALYVKTGAPFLPLILGGNQEGKRRGSTYNTVGIIGFKAALEELKSRNTPKLYAEKVAPLRDELARRILTEIPGSSLNTPLELSGIQQNSSILQTQPFQKQPGLSASRLSPVLPNILNVSFEAAEGESIQLYLDADGIIVSTGSACAAGDIRPSHVLMAKTGDAEVAHSSIRFSFGLTSTEKDIERVMAVLPNIISRLQGISTIKRKES